MTKKEQLETLRNNYRSIVSMLDTLIMEEFKKDFPDLNKVKAASDLLDRIAIVSSQSAKMLVELLESEQKS